MTKEQGHKTRKKKKLTLAQRLAFQGPIGKGAQDRAEKVIPSYARMGVKVCG